MADSTPQRGTSISGSSVVYSTAGLAGVAGITRLVYFTGQWIAGT